MQYSEAAELNSEATLNCNGKDFKCVNSTHYQPCSLVERNGQPPQYSINGVILPCSPGVACNDENTVNCAVQRQAVPVAENSAPSEIPVKVTVEDDAPVAVADVEKSLEPETVSNDAIPAKSLPLDDVAKESADAVVESNVTKEPAAPAPSNEVSSSQVKGEDYSKLPACLYFQ